MLLPLVIAAVVAVGKPTPLAVESCQGPTPTRAAACPKCAERHKLAAPAAPWLDVAVLVAGDVSRPPSRANVRHLFLAGRLPSGWWLCPIGREGAAADGAVTSMVAEAPEAKDILPGGGAELKVEVGATTTDEPPRPQIDVRRLHLCGVGPSRAPSCTALEIYRFAGELSGSRETPARFLDGGTILLEGTVDGQAAAEQRYRVAFP